MATYTKPRIGAIALGLLCAAGAGGVLLEDIRHTGTLTLDHGLSLVVLIGTIGAGIMAVEAGRTWHLVQAVALALLFITGSLYCVMSTAGRTAETRMMQVSNAEHANTEREQLDKLIASAETMLAEERRALAKECKTGAGRNCKGIERSIAVYEAAVKGHKADLAKLGPIVPVNAKVKNVSALVTAIRGGDPAAVESLLTLVDPNIPALFLELGSILFLHIGFAGRVHATADRPLEQQHGRSPHGAPQRPRKRAQERQERVASFVRAYRAKHGHDPSPRAVRDATGLPRSTAWRYQQQA